MKRHVLNLVFQRVTGRDIGDLGVMEGLPVAEGEIEAVGLALGLGERRMRGCRTVGDVLDLMEDGVFARTVREHPVLFASGAGLFSGGEGAVAG